MFNSGRNTVSSAYKRVAPRSNYQSFQSFAGTSVSTDRKRHISVSSDSTDNEDLQVIEHICRDESAKSTKHKKEKKSKKHKKHKKKRRRSSTESLSDSDYVSNLSNVQLISSGDVELNADNYKFERFVKSHPLRIDGNRDAVKKEHKYSGATFSQSVAKERHFRTVPNVWENGMIPLSLKPLRSDDEDDSHYDKEGKGISLAEYTILRKKRWEPELTTEDKKSIAKLDLDKDESNLTKWLNFLKAEEDCHNLKNDDSKFGYLERRLSIISSGLSRVSKVDAVALHLEYIKTLIEMKGPQDDEIAVYLQKVLNLHPNAFSLWSVLIEQQLHNISMFNFPSTVAQFDMSLIRLNSIMSKVFVSHIPLDGTDEYITDLMVNRCRLYIESGYFHKAIAMTQAATEYMFFMPAEVKQKAKTEKVHAFTEFWDVCMPRIGDKGAVGWCNTKATRDLFDHATQNELEIEKRARKTCDSNEADLFNTLKLANDVTQANVWNQWEKLKMASFWRPLRFNHEAEIVEFVDRMVVFDEVKSVLVDFGNSEQSANAVFRLLQALGAVVPRTRDDSVKGMLGAILPDDFFFLHDRSADILEFLIELMFQLLRSSDFPEISKLLCAIILTAFKVIDKTIAKRREKILAIQEYQKRIYSMNFDSEVMLPIEVLILEQVSKLSSIESYWTAPTNDVTHFNEMQQSFFKSALLFIGNRNPCVLTTPIRKQMLLATTLMVAQRLLSHHHKDTFSRLRFLTFLVLPEKLADVLDEKLLLLDEHISTAQNLWQSYAATIVADESINAGPISFMDSAPDLIMKLFTIFQYELKSYCPFCDMNDETINSVVDKSEDFTVFRLDFHLDVLNSKKCTNRLRHSQWVSGAFRRYPKNYDVCRHLANVQALSLRSVDYPKFRREIAKKSVEELFSVYTAEYIAYKKACKTAEEDTILKVRKRLEKVMEDLSGPLCNSICPDSSIFRVWHYFARVSKDARNMEKIYLLGFRSCPFSKIFLHETTDCVQSPLNRMDDIKSLCDKHDLYLFVAPNEVLSAMDFIYKK